MCDYKLKEPKKTPLADRLLFYCFAAFLSFFLVYIMLIRPLTMPADKMPFILSYNPKTHQVNKDQKTQYALWTGGAMLAAALFTIPTARRSNKYDYALAKLYANRNYITHEEYMEIIEVLKPTIIKDNNADLLLQKLEDLVDKHKGKDLRVQEYHMKPEYAENLPRVNA